LKSPSFLERQFLMANQIGKRYRCTKCGAEFIVTRGGDGTIHCCGKPMELKK
jgi:desulfoferrodoxin-like iron-binding protein